MASRYLEYIIRALQLIIPLLVLLVASDANAGPREQAKRLHDRIAGVPPSETVLTQMENFIQGGNPVAAADLALDNPSFYSVTLKNLVTPWTNEEQTVFVPLNDYTATVIGVVRDDLDFRRILYDDILYTADSNLGLPAYSMSNNNHYQSMEDQGVDLKQYLVQTTQSAHTTLPSPAAAGIMTTRAAAKAFFIDGTNRAMFRFTVLNHLCADLEQIKDNTRAPDRIRQDVSRSPGGDSRIFLNSCLGCHAGMDPLTQAYAYYNYQYDSAIDPEGNSGQLVYTPGQVQPKYLINANNFEHGYVTTSDRWDNYWRKGNNELLGWDTNNLSLPATGNGAKSMGIELANSEAFASCQVKKVFENVCFREPTDTSDRNKVDEITTLFKSGYNLKQVYAEAAVYCMGD